MRDRGVREHPLHAGLNERGKVAHGERRTGDHGDRDRPEPGLLRKRGHEHAHRQHQRGGLRRRRHERRHGRRRALVDVRRPHVERRRRALEPEPADQERQARDEQRVVRERLRLDRARDLVEAQFPGRAVDERGAEEQHCRPEAADDQVLQPGFQGAGEVDVDRAEDVEADREPLEPEEERHQRACRRQERHPGARPRDEGVVLGDVIVGHRLGVGGADGEQARAGDDDLRQRPEPVALDRAGDYAVPVCRVRVEQGGEDDRGREPERAGGCSERPAPPVRQQHRREEGDTAGREQRQRRGDREPVDVRCGDPEDHGGTCA